MMIDEIILGEPIQIDFHLAPWGFIVRITTTNRIKISYSINPFQQMQNKP